MILYASTNGPVIHRVIEVREGGGGSIEYITKGDANEAPDSDPVKPEQVRGRVIGVVPDVGGVSLWLKQALNAILRG